MKKVLILLIIIAAGIALLSIIPLKEIPQQVAISPSPSLIIVPDNWETYSDSSNAFRIKYDPRLQVDEVSSSETRWFIWGPTQAGETELYDGILFSIRRNRGSMEAGIQARLEDFRNVGSITVPLHDVVINGTSAKSFKASSLGEFTMIFIPTSIGFLEIAYIAPDPTVQGFQEMVDMMLSTLTL